MSYQFTGKVIDRSQKREGEGKNGHWSTISYTIEEVNVQYPRKVCVEIFGDDKVSAAMSTKLGNKIVTAHFDIDSSKFKDNWYNRIRCWKLVLDDMDVLTGRVEPQPQSQPTPQQVSSAPANSGNMGQGDAFPPEEPQNDDLPF